MKQTSVFVCQKCGEDWPKWAGKCPACSAWNALVETVVSTTSSRGRKSSTGVKPVRLSEVKAEAGYKDRIPTGMGELDRVLGGGIVADSEPEAEYQETLDKAKGMMEALKS